MAILYFLFMFQPLLPIVYTETVQGWNVDQHYTRDAENKLS